MDASSPDSGPGLRDVPQAHPAAGTDEFLRPAADLRAEHLLAGNHGQHGYGKTYSLTFLLALNAGAVVGGLVASTCADRFGPKRVVSTTFVIAAVALVLLTLSFPLPVLLVAVAFAGVGSLGRRSWCTASSPTTIPLRPGAGVAWCAGFGRLGGIFGPLVGGFLISAQAPTNVAFLVFAAVALIGGCVTMVVRSPQAITVPAEAPETVSQSASVGNHV